jgi:hypothetical protein
MHAKFTFRLAALCVGLFVLMLLFLELGRTLGLNQAAIHGAAARSGIGVVDGAVYAVLALLLGFVFSGATTRFDHRRELVAKQVAATDTAWSRIDALPSEAQPEIRDGFRRYLDAVLAAYARVERPGTPAAERLDGAKREAERDLWSRAVEICVSDRGEKARMLLLPSMNEMFDATLQEDLARRMHPPAVIWGMLVLAAVAASLFAGYSMANEASRNWLFHVGIAATISIVTYVIADIEYPRLGLVRVDSFDRALIELRASIGATGESETAESEEYADRF